MNTGIRAGTRHRVVVIGAGTVGVMTAYALARYGKKVTVIDSLPGPAELCSYANAGVLAVGHAKAWAGPEAIGTLARALAGRAPSVRVTRLADPALWHWGLAFLAQCTPSANRTNTTRLQHLALYSRNLLARAEADMTLPADTRHDGGLYLFQNEAQFMSHVTALESHSDEAMEVLGRADLVAREPSLAPVAGRLVGGLFSPNDSVGDCHLFTTRTAKYLADTGNVEFRYGARVIGFLHTGNRVEGVETTQGRVPCSEVVLATGVETPDITRALGFSPNIYPVKGYSGTWRVLDPAGVPRLPLVDETELLAVATHGDSLRVTAIAEFSGRDKSMSKQGTALLESYVRRTFGAAVDLAAPRYWTGLRPTTPAGPPYLGQVRHLDNLWINAGHGQLGWTMAVGSGEILAQLMTGASPDLTDISARARWLVPF